MKRQEQNQMMKEKILSFAFKEFSENGYDKASLNHICQKAQISKGIIYHYFQNKDDLYLACASLCMDEMNRYYSKYQLDDHGLESYMKLRMMFFEEYPLYRQMFFQMILHSPDHLKEDIHGIKKEFEKKNQLIYQRFLSQYTLRKHISMEQALEYIDFIQNAYNHYFSEKLKEGMEFETIIEQHEKMIFGWIDMMLYGIVKEAEK